MSVSTENDARLPLTPEARRFGPFQTVTSLVLADGIDWPLPLAVAARPFDEIRDRLFDHSTLTGTYRIPDVIEAAYCLLVGTYDLERSEVTTLLKGILEENESRQALVTAITSALFGTIGNHRTYSQWVRSALLSNGLDPDRIPPECLQDVLKQLVETGRACEAAVFISSISAADRRSAIFRSLGVTQPK